MNVTIKNLTKHFGNAFKASVLDMKLERKVFNMMLKEISYPLTRVDFEKICLKYNVTIKSDDCCNQYMEERLHLNFCTKNEISPVLSEFTFIPEYIYDIRGYSLLYFNLNDFSNNGENFKDVIKFDESTDMKSFLKKIRDKNNISENYKHLLTFPLSRENYELFCNKLNEKPKSDIYCCLFQKRDGFFSFLKLLLSLHKNKHLKNNRFNHVFFMELAKKIRGISYQIENKKLKLIKKFFY